jgi:hypothetical protein
MSGNPLGRPRAALDVQALAREYTVEAIQTLVSCLNDPKYKVAAATALLDRAWGRPMQAISGAQDSPPVAVRYIFEWASAQPELEASPAVDTSSDDGDTDDDDTSKEIRVVWNSC